jgi:phosphohistidine phosphatase
LRLIVLRHAEAGDLGSWSRQTSKPDSLRPLTEQGGRDMKKISLALELMFGPIDKIWTSPYLRAQETAAGLESILRSKVEVVESLASGASPTAIAKVINAGLTSNDQIGENLVVVGHQPDLSMFISWATTKSDDLNFELKKAAFVWLDFENKISKGEARLSGALNLKMVKRLLG